ncbi:MAG: GNAT family N-acetyltransferase [Leptolyngbyaceae cyanobacterium CSU_1_4]|nr:GNAT family N-acetyltransferase [Leptolyngbyaceae cyanobacterium CSU_1_4]
MDDLIVSETLRSQKYGQRIFEWLIEYAKLHHCKQLHLEALLNGSMNP